MTALAHKSAPPAFDVSLIRKDFPILARQVHGKPLVFLDSAASTQKPRAVLDAMTFAFENEYANVHRGAYWLSEKATINYEAAREKVRAFINAKSASEVVFTKGATDAINLVAASYGCLALRPGDEIVLTELEPINADGSISIDAFAKIIGPKTKIVAVAHVSNVLGTVLPIEAIAELTHKFGAKLLVDGCQGIVHEHVDVQAMGCDFYVFSGHKLYGPNAIGVLWARLELLDAMPPYQGGGDMIATVTFEKSTWAEAPTKFEAGTPPIVPAIGLGAAIDYLNSIDRVAAAAHERDVLQYAMVELSKVPGVKLIGTAQNKASLQSFTMEGAHPHDLATVLDRSGVCVRAGHHCAQPLMDVLGVSATARASFGIYSTRGEVDALVAALHKAREVLL